MTAFLVVGDTEDLTMAWAARVAGECGCEILRLPETGFGETWSVTGPADRAVLRRAGERDLPLGESGPAMVRFEPEPDIPAEIARDPLERYLFARERRAGIHNMLAHLPFPVCNPPYSGAANNSKPLQMQMLAQAGFEVPEWIVTNDPATAEEFVARHGECVVKAASGMRSQVRPWSKRHLELLQAGTAPVLLQRRIRGANVRVHAFGESCFATRIDCPDLLDYRFETGEQNWRACEAPNGLAQRCVDYNRVENLLIGGFDFIVADGTWWCLECNPAPTFITYEFSSGQPIGRELVRYLLDLTELRGGRISGL